MKKMILVPLCVAALIQAGCSTSLTQNSDATPAKPPASSPVRASALEGTWRGHEATTDAPQGTVSLMFSGQTIDYHGTDENDWVKGTFTIKPGTKPIQMVLTVTSSPGDKSDGRVVNAIYEIEDGVLKISGNAPGDEAIPATFDAPGSRQFVLKHD